MHSIKLGQYKDLNVKRVQPMNEEELANASERAYNDAVKNLERFGREIQNGDIILVKLDASIDNQPVKDLCKESMEYDVGNLSMLPEYSKAAGKKVGQTFEMHIPYSQSCPVKEARGKVVDYKVAILDARFATEQEPTLEMLRIMDPQAKSVEDVKEKIKFMIQSENEKSLFESNVLKVMQAIRENAKVTLDAQAYDNSYKQILEQSAQMYEKSNIPLPEGCTDIRNDQHFLENCKKVNEQVVMENLIINAVSEAEQITVSAEEIEKGKKIFAPNEDAKAEFEKHFPNDYAFSAFLLRNKVFDAIMKWNLVD